MKKIILIISLTLFYSQICNSEIIEFIPAVPADFDYKNYPNVDWSRLFVVSVRTNEEKWHKIDNFIIMPHVSTYNKSDTKQTYTLIAGEIFTFVFSINEDIPIDTLNEVKITVEETGLVIGYENLILMEKGNYSYEIVKHVKKEVVYVLHTGPDQKQLFSLVDARKYILPVESDLGDFVHEKNIEFESEKRGKVKSLDLPENTKGSRESVNSQGESQEDHTF